MAGNSLVLKVVKPAGDVGAVPGVPATGDI